MLKDDTEDEQLKRKKRNSLIIPILFAFLATGFFFMRFSKILELSFWVNIALGGIIFLTLFTVTFLLETGTIKIKKEGKEKEKANRVEFVFLVVDAIMTGGFTYYNWNNINSLPMLWAIAEVAVFFAVVWAFFELYNRFTWIPFRLLGFTFDFVLYICVPMLFVWIIFLGGLQAKYNYVDAFTPAVNNSSIIFNHAMEKVYPGLVFQLYEIGQSNPDLWSWLPIAAMVIATLILVYQNFTKKEKTDEEKTAAELLKEVINKEKEELHEEKRKPLFNIKGWIKKLLTSKKEIEKEAKEKEEEERLNKNLPKYQITLKQLKGGQ